MINTTSEQIVTVNSKLVSAYTIAIILSVLTMAATVVFICCRAKKSKEKKYVLTGLHILTLGTFIACFLCHLPFYFGDFEFRDGLILFRPVIMSIHTSLQAFVLGFNYRDLIEELSALPPVLNALYTLWVAILYVIAPILTLSNILSLFNDLKGELRIKINRRKTIYIFSELNERSLAAAASIARLYEESRRPAVPQSEDGGTNQNGANAQNAAKKTKPKKPLFVFTDCFVKDEEPDQDKMQAALNLKGICLKKDITHLNLRDHSCKIEFFLIGEDESENIEQAVKLNEIYKDAPNCSVYLYSSKPSAGYILDSLDKGKQNINSKSVIDKDAHRYLKDKKSALDMFSLEDCYYIRRVNIVDAFTTQALCDRHLMEQLSRQAKEYHRISIMIVGLGEYGKYFLKNALWLYQLYGCTLNIQVIDAKDKDLLHKSIAKEMPGVAECIVDSADDSCLRYYAAREGGDCRFDIRVYHGVQCDFSDPEELFKKLMNKPNAHAENFFDIQAVFITLGDDNKNIEAAVELRRTIDRIKTVSDKPAKKVADEIPMIYSVVYDNKTAKNLSLSVDGSKDDHKKGIINFNNVPYHIHFIGQMSHHFTYSIITMMKEREMRAIGHHFGWIYNEIALRKWFHPDQDFLNNADQTTKDMLADFQRRMQEDFVKNHGGKEEWNDSFLYFDPPKTPDPFDPENLNPEAITQTVRSYADFEYYRDSSVAKEIYCKEIRDRYYSDYFGGLDTKKQHREAIKEICSCPKCEALRINEHIRWNAYMIAHGFRCSAVRNDRAKMHCNIKPWKELPLSDKYKD
ncbi:MAG: hypothetical protein IJH07_07860 [Ruminococcus sp.]|nr:hypothetical protein [Ruminococcus sp.]